MAAIPGSMVFAARGLEDLRVRFLGAVGVGVSSGGIVLFSDEFEFRVGFADVVEPVLGALEFALKPAHLGLAFGELVEFLDAVQKASLVIFDQTLRSLLQISNRDMGIFAFLNGGRHYDFRPEIRVLLVRMIECAARGYGDGLYFHGVYGC